MDVLDSGLSYGSSFDHRHEFPSVKANNSAGNAESFHKDFRQSLHVIIAELVHQQPEVRGKALIDLQSMLATGLLNLWDSQGDALSLLRRLLEWFNLPSPSPSCEVLALSILTSFGKDDFLRQLLVDLGAAEFMEQYERDASAQVVPWIKALLHTLHPRKNYITTSNNGSDAELNHAIVGSTNIHIAGMGKSNRGGEYEQGFRCAADPIEGKSWECNISDDTWDGGVQIKTKNCAVTVDQVHGKSWQCNISNDNWDGEVQITSGDCALMVDKQSEHEQEREDYHGPQSRLDDRNVYEEKNSISPAVVNIACSNCPTHRGLSCKALEAHESREISKASVRFSPPDEHRLGTDSLTDNNDTDDFGNVLPYISLEESDDKYLFDLNVTLQYLDDRQVLIAAMKALAEGVVFDFHPEAILQKHTIVQNTFVLLQKVTDSDLEQMVFDFLLELVLRIKGALKLSTEACFQVHPDKDLYMKRTKDNVNASQRICQPDLEQSYPIYVKPPSHDAFNVSERVAHLLIGKTANSHGNSQQVLSLGPTVHLIAIQLISLLVNERHQAAAFTILYELLPLLKPSEDKNLTDKAQVHFTQYFHGLCEVLQALNGNSEDLETLCTEVKTTRNFDRRARHTLPVLSVLTFSAELLCLLKPCHVAGLVPSTIVKAFTITTGDQIITECTFEMLKHILPYMKYLDPDFYKSYTCAREASVTLQELFKILASSEEAFAQSRGKGSKLPSSIDSELLLKCMIQAAPYYSYFNDKYLISRQVHILSNVLRMELVKACKGNAYGNNTKETSSVGGIESLRGSSLHSTITKAKNVIFLFISHASPSVRRAAYDSLIEVSHRERRHAREKSNSKKQMAVPPDEACVFANETICIDESDCLLQWKHGVVRPLSILQKLLMSSTSIMGEIITAGLHDAATCKQSGELLLHLLEDLSAIQLVNLMPVHPWIACCRSLSTDLGVVVKQISSILLKAQSLIETERHPRARNGIGLGETELSNILRSLFSSCNSERWNASTELLKALENWYALDRGAPWWLKPLMMSDRNCREIPQRPEKFLSEEPSQRLKDPFWHCLLYKQNLASVASGSFSLEPRKKGHLKISLSGQKRLEDLLSIFKSASVGETIRKSAVEHLTWIIQDPSMCYLLESDEELFKALISEILNWIKMGKMPVEVAVPSTIIMDNLRKRQDVAGQIHNAQCTSQSDLGMVCLSLLVRLASASSSKGDLKVREMLVSNSYHYLGLLLPAVFHPAESVRKDMALLLAFCLFSTDVLFTGLEQMGYIGDHTPNPYTGKERHSDVSLETDVTLLQIFVPLPFVKGHYFPCRVVAVDNVRQSMADSPENLVDERFVHRFIAQSFLLEGGYENLLTSLESKMVSPEEPLQNMELQALACISVLHADTAITRLLKLLSDPKLSDGLEIQFFEELEVQTSRHPQAAKLLATKSWLQTFERFLARLPSTPEESAQLLKVLKLVRIILSSKSADSSSLLFLALITGQTLLPILAKDYELGLVEGSSTSAMDLTILRMIVDILLCSMEHTDQGLFFQVAVRLGKGKSFLSVLLSKFVKSKSAPYMCCVLAVQCFSLVAKGLATSVSEDIEEGSEKRSRISHKDRENSSDEASEVYGDVSSRNSHLKLNRLEPEMERFEDQDQVLGTSVDHELVQVIVPLIKHMAHLQSHDYFSLRHKCLVREIVSCLWSVISSVVPCLWQDLWTSTGITYWLARLVNDQEAIVRGMTFGIIAVLASPATPRTRELLAKNWPELGDVAVWTVLDKRECYAVRERQLSFLVASTAWANPERCSSIMMEENSPPVGFQLIDNLGINAALQRYEFWRLLPSILLERNGTPGFSRVLVELIQKLTIADVEFIKTKILEVPAIFQVLIQHLESEKENKLELRRSQEGSISRCSYLADIYAVKSHVCEILSVLALEEDARIQYLVQSEATITKLLAALAYSLSRQNMRSWTYEKKAQIEENEVEMPKDIVDSEEKKYSTETIRPVADYGRVKCIFRLSEVLNLVICRVIQTSGPVPTRAIDHIRVEDVASLDGSLSANSKPQEGQAVGVRACRPEWQQYLRVLGTQSELLTEISIFLGKLPIFKGEGSRARRQESGSWKSREALLKGTQLALCSLIGTLLSEESLAKATLKEQKLEQSEDKFGCDQKKTTQLAGSLYKSLFQLLEDAHEHGKQTNVSRGDFLTYLQSVFMGVGRALQNLLTFSSQAKDAAVDSGLTTALIRHASEVYAFLGSCGVASSELPLSAPPPTMCSASNLRSKRCNKVPKLINQPRRSAFLRASCNQVGDSSPVCSKKSTPGKFTDRHRDLLQGEIIISVRLLKNLMFENRNAAETSLRDGALELVSTLWFLALSEEDLMHELLGLLNNLAALSNAAKEIIALHSWQGKTAGTLMDRVSNMVLNLPLDQTSYTLSIGLLQTLLTMAEPRTMFLRKRYFSRCLERFGNYVQTNDVLRQHLMLQLFINASAFQNGQKMFLRGLSGGCTLDLILDSIEQSYYVPAASAALFLLRNLAFCRETRFFFLCNDRTLPLLVKSLQSSSLEARAYASSALWVLTSSERRISAVLKRIGACPLLVAAHEASKEHLKMFQIHMQQKNVEQNLTNDPVASKMELLVRHTEQSLFAVNQLVGGNWEFD